MLRMKWLILAILCFVGAAIYFWWPSSSSFAYRQVKAVAPVERNHLLEIGNHIRYAERPAESYSFPIPLGEHGPTKSLYSGDLQYPFYCMTLNSNLGQPLIDNQEGLGVPVYRDIDIHQDIIGYSKDCNIPSQLYYYSVDENNEIKRLTEWPNTAELKTNVRLLRVEQGTINRFIYTVIMPITTSEVGDRVAQSQWNKRLIYQFNGGSGIGYRQGRQKATRVIQRQLAQLLDGYAVIASSGNRTSYTYNMLLAEDTARRVKRHFVSLYGEPLYTVGIGGSGGGLAQYLIGQNSQGVLDGLIPLYSYPDMITQTTYALDCDLLNNYFTFRAENRSAWLDWQRRQRVEGLNALNDFPQRTAYLQPVNQIMAGFVPQLPTGNSECINGYFGLSSFINNPKQGFIRDFYHEEVVEQTIWSYWQDMAQLFGKDEHGYGRSTWDNVGVQYGLLALIEGDISKEEFLDINRKIGSWKPQHLMQQEDILTPLGRKLPIWLSLWGNKNITEITEGVATRHQGSIDAMHAAYRWGQVFIGKVDLPIIDVRHYLEDELDMHHMSASFYSRLRILQANGHADNHVIWLAHKDHNPVSLAFEQMDKWLLTHLKKPSVSVVEAKPETLKDQCFDRDGITIASGDGVFDGQWNQRPLGQCLTVFPMFSTSRIQAGGTWAGDIFKCQLISVKTAIKRGIYRHVDVTDIMEQLNEIFPDGVCDYQQIDLGRPHDI
ncbi:DUF6351 family protein [Thalassotalea fusca]